MGIMHTFCQALYRELNTYKANKTQNNKKLHPIRQEEMTRLIQILEDAEKQNPTNVRILHKDVTHFLSQMKIVRFIGIFPMASDLHTQLSHIVTQPEFDPAQMVIIELQEQQANQSRINNSLNVQLTQHTQEIALLNQNLAERHQLCETLIQKCNVLKIENAQLKASLKACSDGNTAERFNELHQHVAEQQTTIAQLRTDYEKVKHENQQLKAENHRLKKENRKLKQVPRENTSSPAHQPAETVCYASPLKNGSSNPRPATSAATQSNSDTTVEFKTYGT